MPNLAVYSWEREKWAEYQKVETTLKEAEVYVRKLARHFKVGVPLVTGGKRQGRADYFGGFWHKPGEEGYNYDGRIRFTTHSINLGTICHEFAHHLVRKRHGRQRMHHGKKFKRELGRVYTFAKRYLPLTKTA